GARGLGLARAGARAAERRHRGRWRIGARAALPGACGLAGNWPAGRRARRVDRRRGAGRGVHRLGGGGAGRREGSGGGAADPPLRRAADRAAAGAVGEGRGMSGRESAGAARTLPLPAEHTLAAGLAAVFGVRPDELVFERRRNPRASTFPSEFVDCRLPDGRRLELCCKYGADETDGSHGHRGNAAYEGAVYRLLMRRGLAGVPRLYGMFAEEQTGRTWLVLERVPGVRIDDLSDQAPAMR